MAPDRMQRQRFEIKYVIEIVHVAFEREARVDSQSDRVRVTFDRRVRTERRTVAAFETRMVNASEPFGNKVIVEIKFTDRFPNWCEPFVSHFGLMQCGAAKYCEGLAGLPECDVSHVGDFRERPWLRIQDFEFKPWLRRAA